LLVIAISLQNRNSKVTPTAPTSSLLSKIHISKMRFIIAVITAASLMTVGLCDTTMFSAYTAPPKADLLELQQKAYQNRLAELRKRTNGCMLENVTVRKEWQSNLSPTSLPFITMILRISNYFIYRGSRTAEQRIKYTNAVLCLQSKITIHYAGICCSWRP
jgi:hypothetical protein